MADSSPPRIVRSLTGGAGAKVFHAKHFNGETVPGGGGGGLERGFTGAGGSGFSGTGATRESGDPAVTGNFDYNRVNTFLGFPIAGGGLTEKGKRDQADSDILNKGQLAYADAINGGATQTEAFTAAVRAGGGAPYLSALMSHPSSPLASLPTAHAFLSGGQPSGPQSTQIKGADGRIYNVDVNPDGSMGNPRDVGLPGTPQKPEKPTVLHTDKGYATLGPDGRATPLTWSNGNPIPGGGGVIASTGGPTGQVGLPPSGKTGAPAAAKTVQSDIPGVGAQATDVHTGSYNATNIKYLRTVPGVMEDLSRLVTIAPQFAGLGKGAISVASGTYLGTTQVGIEAAGILNRLAAATPAMAGTNYKAGIEVMSKALVDSPNNAPSMITKNVPIMMNTLRSQGQDLANTEALSHGKFDGSMENDLERAGIVSPGYQTRDYLEGKGLTGAKWMFDNGFGAQASKDQAGLVFANRDKMPPATMQAWAGEMQRRTSGQQAQTQQNTATTAANAAQPGGQPKGPQPPSPAWDALPTAEPGAGTPQGPGQGQPQPGPQSSAAPGTLSTGMVGANGQPLAQPNVAQDQPGTLATGMPTSNGTVPQGQPNPLPQVPVAAQTATPQGQPPNPSVASPSAAAIGPNAGTMDALNAKTDAALAQANGGASAPIPPASSASSVPNSPAALSAQAQQDSLAAQQQLMRENGGKPVAGPGAEGLSITPGM